MTALSTTRYGAPFMSKREMEDIQKLFDGEAWQNMILKSDDDIAKMKVAGAICAHVLDSN